MVEESAANGESLVIKRDGEIKEVPAKDLLNTLPKEDPSFLDIAGGGLLLDWRYIPLEERSLYTAENELTDYRINLGADYTLLPSLELKIQHQYGRGMSNDIDNADEKSHYTRNLVNSFTQFDGGNSISRPIPTEDIRRIAQNNYTSHFGRAQLSYEKTWNEHHHLTAFTAFEINSTASETNAKWPIPQKERELNPNLTKNPNW